MDYIKLIIMSSRKGSHPSQSFPHVWGPRAAPCRDVTPWVMKQDLRCSRKMDLTLCMALPLQFCMYQSFYVFIFLLPNRQRKRPSLQGFAEGLEELQTWPYHQICCHHCSGHHPPGTAAAPQSASGAHRLCPCHCSSW